uniref:Ig-like domain-containing protein n=1 Tax=Esox lucius TaxID=8010 RepID=A0AAY5KGL9_ESOLU
MVVLKGEGESVTLLCSNISTVVGHVAWFKQVNRSEPVCISTMYSSHPSTVSYYLENRHFEMYSNTTTIFLNITKVEIADSGLYFCGFFSNTKHMVFVSAKCLNVQGKRMCLVLFGVQAVTVVDTSDNNTLIALLSLCFCDVISTLQDVDEDKDLNYAAKNFSQKTPRNKKSQLNMMDMYSDVVYTSTR